MKRTHIALAASTLLLLTACSGTGGASHDGEVYLGAPSSGPTVQQIMELADSGDVEAIVNLITKSTAAAAGGVEPDPSPVTFQADELGIPMGAGFTVDILMTVTDDSGTSTKTFTSTVADDGSISFDIPPVVTGSEVSIRMDVRDDSGMLVQTGRAKKTVSGDSDTLELTLSTNFRISLTPPAGVDAWCWMVNEDPNDPMLAWTSSCLGDLTEYTIPVAYEGNSIRIGGLAVKGDKIYEIPLQTITVGDVDSVALTMNPALNFPDCVKLASDTNASGTTVHLETVEIFSMYNRVAGDSSPAISVTASNFTIWDGAMNTYSAASVDDDDFVGTFTLTSVPSSWVMTATYEIKDYYGNVIASGSISNDGN